MRQTHDFRHVPVARSPIQRTFGLMGRKPVSSHLFLYIPKCSSVHTWFMRSSVDLIFLNEQGMVVSTREKAPPWRVHNGPPRAAHVLELPPGHARRLGISIGDYAMLPGSDS